ncbi:TniQ family protein [Azospirillum argentinense]|uniref:TniQ domain-containing protein n=1 Tax=Azospirillum brasilense TaxID=192 RepID=A0A4D8Q7T8_AZOBR|nr:hypothetical protein D3867_29600 [Azospirillum argentinense]
MPASGEALGSWVRVIARTYGLMPGPYLRRLGIPHRWVTKAIHRDLVIRPLPSVMERLQADTGVAPEVLRRMTFSGLDRELEEACNHYVPCAACVDEASRRAGQPVNLLHAWAVYPYSSWNCTSLQARGLVLRPLDRGHRRHGGWA